MCVRASWVSPHWLNDNWRSDLLHKCTLSVNEEQLLHTHTRARARAFNGLFSGTTQVSPYQQGKTNLDFTEARDSEWQWHQLGHMQV